jgi:hypothetical protein
MNFNCSHMIYGRKEAAEILQWACTYGNELGAHFQCKERVR